MNEKIDRTVASVNSKSPQYQQMSKLTRSRSQKFIHTVGRGKNEQKKNSSQIAHCTSLAQQWSSAVAKKTYIQRDRHRPTFVWKSFQNKWKSFYFSCAYPINYFTSKSHFWLCTRWHALWPAICPVHQHNPYKGEANTLDFCVFLRSYWNKQTNAFRCSKKIHRLYPQNAYT